MYCYYKWGLDAIKPVLGGGGEVANNTVADQPAHPRSLISAFVIRVLESNIILYKLATSEQAGMNLTLSETPKSGFVTTRPNVLWLYLTVPRVGLQCVITLFPDHTPFSRDLTIPHLDLSHFALCIMGN